MLKRLIENFVLKATDWWFRVSAIERYLITSGIGLLIAIFGGVPLIAELLRLALGAVPVGYINAQQWLSTADLWILVVASVMVSVGLALAVARFVRDSRLRSKKRVLVIEARGLRDDDGAPLAEEVAKHHQGKIIPSLLDLRNRLDGQVIQPERALNEISAAHRSVLQHQKDGDRADLTTVYGGLTSVPYTFLTGVLLDDEGGLVTYDWDRTQESWRRIEGDDDGIGFEVNGLETISDASEVIVALACSYPITGDDLATTFSLPLVRVTLEDMSSDAHWSQKKQNRLAQEFFEIGKQLSGIGVKRIHLVLAAPNSVVFTLGRRYDKRNLPEIIVYQYQRGVHPAYPWGVMMPVSGVDRARVIHTSDTAGQTV